jgi:hypothetical protein
MGKLKKVGISFLVVILVLISLSAVAIWYVFTPEKLTPIINTQAKKYITCKLNIGKVEPTFFSSYPFFAIEINKLCLTDNKSSKIDTIAYASKCYASFDLKSYLFDNDIKLTPLSIQDGFLKYKIDANNKSNLDILKTTTSSNSKEEKKALNIGDIELNNIELKNISLSYVDEHSLQQAEVNNITTEFSANYTEKTQTADFSMHIKKMQFKSSDTLSVNAKDCNITFTTKGENKNNYTSLLKLKTEQLSVKYLGDILLSKIKYETILPFNLNVAEMQTNFKDALIKLNEYNVLLKGNLKLKDNNKKIDVDLTYSTNEWNIEKLLMLVPKAYSAQLNDIKSKGYAQLSGKVKGLVSDKSLPIVDVKLKYYKGEIKYTAYPIVKDIDMNISTKINMNENMQSKLTINNAYAKLRNSSFNVKGSISDILGTPNYDIKANGDLTFIDFKDFIPKDQNIILKGKSLADIHLKFNQSNIEKKEYHKIYMQGKFKTKNLYAIYNDTTKVEMPASTILLELPSHANLDKNQVFAKIELEAKDLNIDMSPNMGAKTHNIKISADINNMVKGASTPITSCKFELQDLYLKKDTINIKAINSTGNLHYSPLHKGKQEIADILAAISSKNITITSKDSVLFDVKNISGSTKLQYNESEKNIIKQWQPTVEMQFHHGMFNLGEKLKGDISNIWFTLNPETMEIKKAELLMGDSDFSLTGQLTDITKYINKEALLKGNFNIASNKTDIYKLMDIFSGMGRQDSTLVDNKAKKEKIAKDSNKEDKPFMVPMGIDIRLETNIKQTIVDDNILENVKGGLTIKDGVLILDQMGFTSKAANMQLTAMYKSSRKNHLFSSIDFHLLNINIEELIDLLPYVDTMVPMLKSFKGKGEFHLAGETYLKSNYELKQSTIRGAAAFEGQDLTLMDNDTFSNIASKLLFEKKTKNLIRNLSVEMTLFKDEIDIYPFLIEMDDYKAVLSGRHNTDNSFNYHISVTDCPLPVRLGLNISGTIDDLNYKLAKCKYKHLYNPKRQGSIEKRTLRLKKLISNSLKKNVKPIIKE